jgi:hypothetical protein
MLPLQADRIIMTASQVRIEDVAVAAVAVASIEHLDRIPAAVMLPTTTGPHLLTG